MCSQSIIWSFITEYKRVLNEDLPYLQLMQSEPSMVEAIHKASKTKDPALKSLAIELEALIQSGGVQFVEKAAKPGKKTRKASTASPVVARSASTPSSANAKGNVAIAGQQYRVLLNRMLSSADITILERDTLDIFCRRNTLSEQEANAIEVDVRLEHNRDSLDWQNEVRNSIQRFLRLHGELTDIDRLLIVNTYVKRARLPMNQMESILSEEMSSHQAVAQPEKQKVSRVMWGVVTLVALLTIAVAGLYFRPAATIEPTALAKANVIPAELSISGSITEDTTWRAQTTYYLKGPVFIEGKTRLTIEPGTRILGEFGSALIVTRDAQIYARGQRSAPIVFTSVKAAGERQRGDWGGLVLLGNASINRPVGQIEGIDSNDSRGRFGGQNDADSCGILEYVRIEFAGFEVFADNELNGLTLGGCGQNTIVRNVQVHRAADDGIEMFGGTADLKNIVITGAKDDSLDWDMGWRGRVQFMVIQQYADAGDNGFEADNWGKSHDAKPRSNPVMYNVTMIGSDKPEAGHRTMNLRRGTAGEFHNFLVMGHRKEFVDIRDEATALLARQGFIQFSHVLVFDIGDDGKQFFSSELDKKDDDNGFSEAAFFDAQNNILFGVDPQLADAQDLVDPEYLPSTNSPAGDLFVTPPQAEFWDENANYAGALRPGITRESAWLHPWTAYPLN